MSVVLPSVYDIEALETALMERVKELCNSYDVVRFPQDGTIGTLHPQGTLAVRFGAFQPTEPNLRQSDRCVWTFEVNVITRYLYSDNKNIGAYSVLSTLLAGLHGCPLQLPDGAIIDTIVTLIDLVTVDQGMWQYVVTINVIAPYVLPSI